MGFDYRTNTP